MGMKNTYPLSGGIVPGAGIEPVSYRFPIIQNIKKKGEQELLDIQSLLNALS
jgi:hypothetical protein